MDKPRHPQVIRPWKVQPPQKAKSQASGKNAVRRAQVEKAVLRKHK